MASVDEIIENDEKHRQERLDKGGDESVLLSNKLHEYDDEVFWHPHMQNRSNWKQSRLANSLLKSKKSKNRRN